MRIARRAAVALSAAAAMLFAVAAPAHAASPEDSFSRETKAYGGYLAGAGEALFFSWGELFYIQDFRADGAGVRAYYRYSGGGWHQATNTNGRNGDEVEINFDLAENLSFQFYVCLEDEGVTISGTCSSTVNAHT